MLNNLTHGERAALIGLSLLSIVSGYILYDTINTARLEAIQTCIESNTGHPDQDRIKKYCEETISIF